MQQFTQRKSEIFYCCSWHYFSSHDQHVWSWTHYPTPANPTISYPGMIIIHQTGSKPLQCHVFPRSLISYQSPIAVRANYKIFFLVYHEAKPDCVSTSSSVFHKFMVFCHILCIFIIWQELSETYQLVLRYYILIWLIISYYILSYWIWISVKISFKIVSSFSKNQK